VGIRVGVTGGLGRMGRETVKAVLNAPDLTLVSVIDPKHTGEDVAIPLRLPEPSGVLLTQSLEHGLAGLDVAVEFTRADSVFANAQAIIQAGVRPVIGATGLTPEQMNTLDEQLKAVGLAGLVIPNFAIGAVLMMTFAEKAARYFDHAEIIELHHNQKADAPSGTALKTATLMADAAQQPFGCDNTPEVELLPGARGATAAGGIRIHSVRLPGLVAHQEVICTSPGQMLTLRHDSFDRACYMPGVLLSIRKVMERSPGLTYGLEHLL
jgi:4-hydroxy-tetrahydrodipicolinate reductase